MFEQKYSNEVNFEIISLLCSPSSSRLSAVLFIGVRSGGGKRCSFVDIWKEFTWSDTDTTWRIAKGYELFLFVIPTCPRPNVLLKMGVNVATNKRGCSSS